MPNYDEKTGIHYGVISPNSVMPEAFSDIETQSIDTVWADGKAELIEGLTKVLNGYGFSVGQIDEVLSPVIDIFNESYESDGSGIFDYSDEHYTLHNSGDNFGLYVIKSPYYTFCRQCSPCAPGAGDLNNPVKIDNRYKRENPLSGYGSSLKTYCLDKSFFEGEKAPYRVYRVDDDQEVV